SYCWPEFKKASAEPKASTERPADFSKRCTATRYDSSSSITATIFMFLSPAIHVQDWSARCPTQLLIVIRPGICMYKAGFKGQEEGQAARQSQATGGSLSFSAILPSSAGELACIFRITCPRCTAAVISVVPSVEAICFVSLPETI